MRSILVASWLLFAGCGNPDEILPVRGQVVSVDPVEGQVVRLLRRYQPFGTGYEQCFSEAATPFKEVQADVEGAYSFDVFRVETQSLAGFGTFCFRVDATFPSGSVAWTDLSGIREETPVARLWDWRAAPRVEGQVIRFEPPIPWPEERPPVLVENRWNFVDQLDHRAQLFTSDGGLAWQVDDHFLVFDGGANYYREAMVLDDVRVEDFSGELTLLASLRVNEKVASGLYTNGLPPVRMRSGERVPVSGARVPLSRGLPCPPFAAPCPLTDGDLTPVDGELREFVTFELPTAAPVSTLVLRGVQAGKANLWVDLTQEDGGVVRSSWPVAQNPAFDEGIHPLHFLPDGGMDDGLPRWVVISLDAGVPVKSVRFQFYEGLSRIQEISIFE